MNQGPPQESRINEHIAYRPARPEDSRAIAHLICQAGGGLYEFLFNDLIPFVSALDVVTAAVQTDGSPLSHANCWVATCGSAQIVGVANVFPADLIKEEPFVPFASDRLAQIRPLLQLQDWGSMLLNAIAVADNHRGRGIGTSLLDWAEIHTVQAGLSRLSLHVWADNVAAIKLYRGRGFVEIGFARIAPHPRLQHVDGSLLMQKNRLHPAVQAP
ncbi:MAG: GNAT family N-acetyltransferase [Bradyrhizobium sp.]|uniref:GNAT family N-acetyltransferase n=1 Tax=Bradyrhizobium sp. TaxID=376 RepID=UPI0025BF33E6|nr:GNAT family N-acetyltransferase [Bradyrhizobium sp.]MBI5265320.1 GNAT family N-acetyltransferase [Bradyrhizobium sp.]